MKPKVHSPYFKRHIKYVTKEWNEDGYYQHITVIFDDGYMLVYDTDRDRIPDIVYDFMYRDAPNTFMEERVGHVFKYKDTYTFESTPMSR